MYIHMYICIHVSVCTYFVHVRIRVVCEIILIMMMFIIVAMQLLRKRHIGNDIVTVIFQDPEAKPFCAKNIRSQFQHVFVVVRCLPASDDKPVKYKYVCLSIRQFVSPVYNCYTVYVEIFEGVKFHRK